MTDDMTQDAAAMSAPSAGSVARDVVEHAKKCVDFWRSMMDGADRIGTEPPSLAIGGVSDLVDGLLDEIERLRLTCAERKAVGAAARIVESREAMEEFTVTHAATLLALLERTK